MSRALKSYLEAERGRATRLAEELGISRSYLSEVASGTKTPSADVAKKLAATTGLPLAAILDAPGFSESTVTPYNPGPRGNQIADIAHQVAPGLAHASLYTASTAAHDFGVMPGDLLITEAKFDPAGIEDGQIVIAQIADAAGAGRTVIARLATPWLVGPGAELLGQINTDGAVIGLLCGLLRGPMMADT